MIKRRSKKKGPVRAKKVSYDNIDFASGLEKYMYIALKKAKLFDMYEGEVFQLIEGFKFPNTSTEKQTNGKGDYSGKYALHRPALNRGLHVEISVAAYHALSVQRRCDAKSQRGAHPAPGIALAGLQQHPTGNHAYP